MRRITRVSVPKAVSDADVLIKLCRAGHLNLLFRTIDRVYVPAYVFSEARYVLARHACRPLLDQAGKDGLFTVVDTVQGDGLTPDQRQGMAITRQSFRFMLDPGELEALALAVEFGIPYILSDDRAARRTIEEHSDVRVLRHPDLLYICQYNAEAYCKDIKRIFRDIQAGESHRLGGSFQDIMRRSRERVKELGLRK
ncbi:hypothetical protein ACUM6F_00615 [Desulforudis sp. DRI-14]